MQKSKKILYQSWQKLTKKQKQKLIDEAKQSEKDRGPNPQQNHVFEEINFIQYIVQQKNKPIKLCTYRHQCKGQPVAVVIMLHGLNSHLGHGAHIAHQLAQKNIITVGFDHRGFGRSEGEPGYAQSLENHIQDSLVFAGMMKKIYPNLPFFCLGLSMGGMTTYYLTLKHKYFFQGAILMAPAIKNMVGGLLVGLTKTLATILPKSMKLMKPIYGKGARNPAITEFIKQDEYSFSDRARLSTLEMLVSTMDKTPQTFSQYQSPFMIIQGGLDKLVNPDGAFELFANCQTRQEDKELLFYQKMWHDVWHQPEIHQIIQKIIDWIHKRIQILNKKSEKVEENKNIHRLGEKVENNDA